MWREIGAGAVMLSSEDWWQQGSEAVGGAGGVDLCFCMGFVGSEFRSDAGP